MKRTYENDAIRVFWDSSRCIHVGRCLRANGEVFDVSRRPWVDLGAGSADEVARAVEECPSGALRYERLDDEPDEAPSEPVTIVPWPNGPLLIRGAVEIRDARRKVMETGTRLALCRCGASKNHPFCDLSHQEIEFRNFPRAESEERREAEAPDDISEEPLR